MRAEPASLDQLVGVRMAYSKVMTKLSVSDLNALWASKRAAGYSANNIRIMRTVLRSALHQAEREGLLVRNVAALSDPPRIGQPEGRSLTVAEARSLLAAAVGDRLEPVYAITLTLGLRRGEVLGLSWPDIDFERGAVHVRRQLRREQLPLEQATVPSGVFRTHERPDDAIRGVGHVEDA